VSRADFPAAKSNIVVYVIGDYMTDVYQSVKATKIAPDAPAPVWAMDGEPITVPGGAGNVARQFTHLSKDVSLVTLGEPSRGTTGLRFLSRVGETWRYPVKSRLVQGGHVLARLDDNGDRGTNPLREALALAALDAMRYDLRSRNVVAGRTADNRRVVFVASDYAGGFWSPSVAKCVTATAGEFGVPLVVDAKPRGLSLEAWAGATVVKLNTTEAAEFTREFDLPEAAVRACADRVGCPVVATQSGRRPIFCRPGDEPFFAGTDHTTTRPVWASGAGDCFAAYLAASVAAGEREPGWLLSACGAAHAAGAVYVTKRHNCPVHPREAMERAGDREAKLYRSPCELTGRLAAIDGGARIGLTNGCFDLLHAGHIESLRFAKSQCDFLAVFLNSDSSYHSLRGENPVLWWSERAAALAALEFVDAVVQFNELDPSRAFGDALGGRIADVLVKGEEYRGKEVKGNDFARKVAFAPETFRVHTSEIVRRIKNRGEKRTTEPGESQ